MARMTAFSTDEVVRLYRTGKSLRDVAALVGASMEGVRGRLIAAGEPIRSLADASARFDWNERTLGIFKDRFEAGDSFLQIANALSAATGAHVTRNAAIGKARRLGWTRSCDDNAGKGSTKIKPMRGPAAQSNFVGGFKRPKLKLVVAGRGAVLSVPAAPAPKLPPPREVDISVALNPKPWLERRNFHECAWPVDGVGADTISCCNPTKGKTYCDIHARVMVGSMPRSWAGYSQPGFAKAMGR